MKTRITDPLILSRRVCHLTFDIAFGLSIKVNPARQRREPHSKRSEFVINHLHCVKTGAPCRSCVHFFGKPKSDQDFCVRKTSSFIRHKLYSSYSLCLPPATLIVRARRRLKRADKIINPSPASDQRDQGDRRSRRTPLQHAG